MQIRNLTKKTGISKNGKICDSVLSKSVGLMLSRNKNRALIFKFKKEKIIPLHMIFVFYSIDVLFLDKNKIVIEKRENFTPFSFYTPKKKAMYVIEMPNGTMKKTKTEVGDKIDLFIK